MELFEGFSFHMQSVLMHRFVGSLVVEVFLWFLFSFKIQNCHEELELEHTKSTNIHDFGHLYRHRLNPTAQTIFTRKNVPVFGFLPTNLFKWK